MSDFGFQEHTALYGGSFNPPHLGHVQAVKGLKELPKLKRILILPSHTPPLKEAATPFEHRLAMTKLAMKEAIASDDSIEVTDLERAENFKYTWQVLEHFSRKIEKRAFVIGTDQFEQLDQWNRYPEVMGMSDWIVLIRKPKKLENFRSTIQKYLLAGWLIPTAIENQFRIRFSGQERKICLVETKAIDVSSTEIRQKLVTGQREEVLPLLPPAVLDYIERNKLYGT
jgi:nicotinate-nucleotide adenylyltransferase